MSLIVGHGKCKIMSMNLRKLFLFSSLS